METLQPLWAARASAHSHLHSKVLPDVQMETPEFWFAPTASCPITRHHRAWLHLLYSLFQVFPHIDEIPLEPSLL